MAARDFIRERRTVTVKGRRFVVSKPTVETVIVAMVRLGVDFASIRRSLLDAGDRISDPRPAVLSFLLADAVQVGKVADVLSTCAAVDGLDREAVRDVIAADVDAARALIAAVLTLCDANRIAAQMNLEAVAAALEAKASDEPESAGPSAVEFAIAVVAENYKAAGVTPFDVMGWPYEAVLTLVDELLPALRGMTVAAHGGAQEADPAAVPISRRGVGTWAPGMVGAHGGGYLSGTIKTAGN